MYCQWLAWKMSCLKENHWMITTKIKEKMKTEVNELLLRVRRKMQVKFNPGVKPNLSKVFLSRNMSWSL